MEHDKQTRSLAQVGLGVTTPQLSTNRKQLTAALHDEDWLVRVAAVKALGKQQSRSTAELLQQALRDENVTVRATAARTLGLQGQFASPTPLVAALDDPAWHVRTAAAQALGKLKGRIPVEPLVTLLDDENASVRAAAVWALGKTGELAPIEKIERALADKAWSVREAAVMALHEQGERVYEGQLLAAQWDEDSSVRYTVDDVLSQRYGNESEEKLKPEAKPKVTSRSHMVLAVISLLLLSVLSSFMNYGFNDWQDVLNKLTNIVIVYFIIVLFNMLYNGKNLHFPFVSRSQSQSIDTPTPAWHGVVVAIVSICVAANVVFGINPVFNENNSILLRYLIIGINMITILLINIIFRSRRA